MKAIEITGTVNEEHQLQLDEPLPVAGPSRVRVIILIPEDEEITEAAWFKAVATNPALDVLNDPTEDIYTLNDGKPFHDQG
ncbi:hypothetical protein HYR54_13290 [Candidatus Acetothermia bacterium]|nr:hypothetical protein [Candidatus Acetothermia bacterium]MBI3661075.1 hypothetical protein [Candidatus Acetothermia bacterium]